MAQQNDMEMQNIGEFNETPTRHHCLYSDMLRRLESNPQEFLESLDTTFHRSVVWLSK